MNFFIDEVNKKENLSNELKRLEYENLDLHTYKATYGNQENHQSEFLSTLSQRVEINKFS